MTASLNFVQIDAIIDDSQRIALTCTPAFSPDVTKYELQAPLKASKISIGATSFSAAQVKIQGVPGSLSSVPLTGSGAEIVASLHDKASDAEVRRYVFSIKQGDVDLSAAEKIEKMKASESTAHAHTHSHGGVPCTHDHGHSHAGADKPKHSHSHGDGKECTEDHGHSHEGKKEHGHSHDDKPKHSHSHGDGKPCTEDHSHSHSHGEKKESHGHSHDEKPKHSHSHGDGKPCTEDHGHSHAEKKEHSHSHDHGHSHTSHSHAHAYSPANDEEMADAASGKYQWNQDSDTVTLEVPIPAGTQGKDVTCAFDAATLRVEVRTLDAAARVVLDGPLFSKVSKDNCSWSIVQEKDKRILVVTLAKMEHLKVWGAVMAAEAAGEAAHGHSHAHHSHSHA